MIKQKIERIIFKLGKKSWFRPFLYPFYKGLGIQKVRWSFKNQIYLSGAEATLNQAKIAIESTGKFFWLEFGTLLGAIRNNDFIKHDLDIDLGMFLDDYTNEIDLSMKSFGFSKVLEIRLPENVGLEQSFEYKGVKVDIFYFTRGENTRWCHVYKIDEENITAYENHFPNGDFKQIKFKDQIFNVPKDTNQHLSFHYGEDFMTPKRGYDYIKDALNTVKLDTKGILLKD